MFKRSASLFLISVLTIVMLSGSVTATPLEDDVNLSIAKAKALNPDELEIIVFDTGRSDIIKNSFNTQRVIKSLDELSKIQSSKPVNAIWITEEMHRKALSEEGKMILSNLLGKGYALVFIGIKDPNLLKAHFTNDKSREKFGDSNLNFFSSIITKNSDGQYIVAHLYSVDDISIEENYENLHSMSWIYGNAKNTVRRKFAEQLGLQKDIISPSSDISAMSFGFNFSIVDSPWIPVTLMEDTWITTNYGTAVEWRQCFHTTVQGQQYYAVVYEHFMEPKQGNTYSSEQLRIQSDLDTALQSNTLRDYYPYIQPTSDTVSAGISWQKGFAPTISATWQIAKNDLNIDISGTGDSYRKVDLKFNYKPGMLGRPTNYASQPSRQGSAFIIRKNDTYYPFAHVHNRREASFNVWVSPYPLPVFQYLYLILVTLNLGYICILSRLLLDYLRIFKCSQLKMGIKALTEGLYSHFIFSTSS